MQGVAGNLQGVVSTLGRLCIASAALLTGSCVDDRGARDLVPIVQREGLVDASYQYCRVVYGPKLGAEASCSERVQQCQELLPQISTQLQAIEVPRRVRDRCASSARDDLSERLRRDPDFSLLYRSTVTKPFRDYDGEAACLSHALNRDIPSVRTTPPPPVCAAAPRATPSAEEIGPRIACQEYPGTPDCALEADAQRAVRDYDGRVSYSLRKRCSALAGVDMNGRASPFRWSRYTSCLRRSLG